MLNVRFLGFERFDSELELAATEMRAAVQTAIVKTTFWLVDTLRQEVDQSGLGRSGKGLRRSSARSADRLQYLWTATVPPSKKLVTDREPFGQVFPRNDAAEQILSAHATGGTFAPRNGRAFAIPLHAYDVSRRLMTPAQIERRFGRKLVFVPSASGAGRGNALGLLVLPDDSPSAGRRLSVLRKGTQQRRARGEKRSGTPMFLLVRAFTLRKVLHPERAAERAAADFAGRLDRTLSELRGSDA